MKPQGMWIRPSREDTCTKVQYLLSISTHMIVASFYWQISCEPWRIFWAVYLFV